MNFSTMNPSTVKIGQPSQEVISDRPDDAMGADAESGTWTLPNELLMKIFGYLPLEQLLVARHVCLRWRYMVSIHLASTRTLRLLFSFHRLEDTRRMKAWGSSLKSLDLMFFNTSVDWVTEIAETFPNLLSLSLHPFGLPLAHNRIGVQDFKDLCTKCTQLVRISLSDYELAGDGLGILLKGFPGLKSLRLSSVKNILEKSFLLLGSNLEDLKIMFCKVSAVGTSHIFSRCSNLKSLECGPGFEWDVASFTTFCKKSSLRSLLIYDSKSSEEFFLPISHLTLLEKLTLDSCPAVDSDVLIEIIHGCPNLQDVFLNGLPLVCDHGLKALAQCKHLTYLNISNIHMMSDETLIEIAKAGLLKKLVIAECGITDRGLAAILAQCPQLEYLDVAECGDVTDKTVDAAIAAVESRGKPIVTVPGGEAVQKSRCLLRLRISDRYLNRDGFSHPLLHLKLWDPFKDEYDHEYDSEDEDD